MLQQDPLPLPPANTPEPPVPSPNEDPTPMLDVHPAHHAANTWRDFFIHIATIVLGLLIAVGIEQTVEYVHHRHHAAEAREFLHREMMANRRTLEDNTYSLRLHEKHLTAALEMLAQLRTHSLPPDAHFITGRSWFPMDVSAWKTARESGAAAYLTRDEQFTFDLADWDAGLFNTHSYDATQALGRATMAIQMDSLASNPASAKRPTIDRAVLNGHAGDVAAEAAWALRSADVQQLSRLTPAQIDRLEQAIQSSLYDDQDLLNTCRNLLQSYTQQATQDSP